MKKAIAACLSTLISASALAGVSIEQYGDSTTAGLSFYDGKIQPAKKSSVDFIYVSINNRFGPAVSIANMGKSGTCAIQLLNGNGDLSAWPERIKQSTASIVTFGYGLNDQSTCHRTPQQFADDLRQLVDLTVSAGKLPVLIEPTPSTTPERKDLSDYVGAMNLVAEERKVPIIQHYKIWTSMSNWQSLLSDGVHPTEQGYQIKGLTEYQALAPIIIDDLRKQSVKRP